MKRLAVIIPWRKGETELQTTIESAKESADDGSVIYPVEDKRGDGPARTRHKGIEAATNADVICLVDAHMQFRPHLLRDMADHVRRTGNLLCSKCFHNPECSFDTPTWYAGAEIHYRARIHVSKDRPSGEQHSLEWKWSEYSRPGVRGCIGGACYAFTRDWYYSVGAPLQSLPGWGCDEELLSICSWFSGHTAEVFDGEAAHRWRSAPPWDKTFDNCAAQWSCHVSMIEAVVSNAADKADLLAWQLDWLRPNLRAKVKATPQTERVRLALLKQPRTWEQWKTQVCKGDISDPIPQDVQSKSRPVQRKPYEKPTITERPTANYGAGENLRQCPKCGSSASDVTTTRKTGTLIIRYRKCLSCGHNRATREICTTA